MKERKKVGKKEEKYFVKTETLHHLMYEEERSASNGFFFFLDPICSQVLAFLKSEAARRHCSLSHSQI